jgi:hypothetical protein
MMGVKKSFRKSGNKLLRVELYVTYAEVVLYFTELRVKDTI